MLMDGKFLSFLPVLAFLLAGCSDLLQTDSSPTEVTQDSTNSQTVLSEDTDFYYYFDEKIYVSTLDNLVFLKFTDNDAREKFISESCSAVSSSCSLDDVIIDIQGTINGQRTWLVSSDLTGSLDPGERAGYPVYRGYTLSATPGTTISNITLDLFASCADGDDDLEIGAAFDTETPTSYDDFSFGMGDTFTTTLPSITVPTASRRRVYIRIFDNQSCLTLKHNQL